jgi:hypothetical protein
MSRETRIRPHAFEPDQDLSREYVTSDRRDDGPRTWCRRCGLPGEPGDERHPAGAPPRYPETPDEVRRAELRRIGERDDEFAA